MQAYASMQLGGHAANHMQTLQRPVSQLRSTVRCDWQRRSATVCSSSSSSSCCRGAANVVSSTASRFPRQLPLRQKGLDSVSCSSSSASTGALDTAGPPGGGSGGGSGGGFGGSGDGAGEGEDDDNEELVNLEEAERVAASSGFKLPADFAALAAAEGLRRSVLQSYAALQRNALLGWLSRLVPAARDRLLADPRYLFIVVSEVLIDSGCATVAEVRKRGVDFWDEFEFYLSDLVVGCVLDVVLVSLMAPTATLGARKPASQSRLQRMLAGVPSAVFEPNRPGARYSTGARIACIGVKFLEYSLAGMVCGFVGQGIANQLMYLKRHYQPGAEGDRVLDIPPLGMTALTWGLFMGASSNLRYQAVFGLERVVDKTIARRVPQIAYVTSFLLRFCNNVVGGENFIDMARWTGIQ
mmetsp:Transcript_6022/g.17239  ORF Transcript_6022/g.17239 Transcript_6022/m.17239 type:complete len:412 (+) Transcript_6022:46-1281(+)